MYHRNSLGVWQGGLPYASRTAYKEGSVASTTPVSYTHLDVYKRQVKTYGSKGFVHLLEQSELMEFTKV